MSKEELFETVRQSMKQMKQPQYIDITEIEIRKSEIERRINETYALIEALQEWLDGYLKN